MVLPGTAYEHSSGGPFFVRGCPRSLILDEMGADVQFLSFQRDIDNQGSDQQELYFYMFSNHMQTEANRIGLVRPSLPSF